MFLRLSLFSLNLTKNLSVLNKLNDLLNEYGESHQNKLNKTIHWFCVPLIFWSIVAIVSIIPRPDLFSQLFESFEINWAMLALLFIMVYYISLSFSLSIGMLIFSLVCLFSIIYVDGLLIRINAPFGISQFSLFVFVVSWILQFYGHKVEGKKPSFLKDIQFLLIGPLWLLSFLYSRFKIPY